MKIRFKLFGLHIWISREPLRVKNRKNRTAYRDSQRNKRLEIAGNHCEVCGYPISKNCHLFRVLPVGTPDRNAADNIRVLCGACWHELQKRPHIHGYQHLEDDTRYEI